MGTNNTKWLWWRGRTIQLSKEYNSLWQPCHSMLCPSDKARKQGRKSRRCLARRGDTLQGDHQRGPRATRNRGLSSTVLTSPAVQANTQITHRPCLIHASVETQITTATTQLHDGKIVRCAPFAIVHRITQRAGCRQRRRYEDSRVRGAGEGLSQSSLLEASEL